MSKRFECVYLHIGMGKTGSTTVQRDLWGSADLLESRYSIHYPVEPVVTSNKLQRGNHSEPLLCAFHPRPEQVRRNVLQGSHTPASALAAGQALRSAFERGFEQSKARFLMLSAEGIPTFDPQAVDNLAAWLAQWCDEIRLFACLRHPADSLSSQIQQRLKVGYTLQELYADPPLYPYARLMPRLEKSFPGSSIHAYDFADAKESPGGLANYLLREMGLAVELPQVDAKPSNASMSDSATRLLDSLNRQFPPIVNGVRNDNGENWAFLWCQRLPGPKYQVPENVLTKLNGLAAPHLEYLAAQHGLQLHSMTVRQPPPRPADIGCIDRRARRWHWLARQLMRLRRMLPVG